MHQPTQSAPPIALRLATVLLLLAGPVLYLLCHYAPESYSVVWILVTLAVLSVAALPWVYRPTSRLLDTLRHPTPTARRRIALGVGLAATVYLAASNVLLDRDFGPTLHDENSYLLQTTMLSHGRLWMPTPPVADFFETFHTLVRPVYGSIYFPGTALLFTPPMLLGLPKAMVALLLAGAATALAYRVLAEAADGLTALTVAVMMPTVFQFYNHSVMIMANIPSLALCLAMVWAWMRWRSTPGRKRQFGWAASFGMLAGWAAITRPADALAFALPLGLAMAYRLLRTCEPLAAKVRDALLTLALVVAAAAPFLGFQLLFNVGVTGHWRVAPYVLYLEQSQPASLYGGEGIGLKPQTTLEQKLLYYRGWMIPDIRRHASMSAPKIFGERLHAIPAVSFPNALLTMAVPLGLLALVRGATGDDSDPRPLATRRVLVGIGLLFLALYTPNPFFLPQYQMPLIPIALLVVVMGIRALERAWPHWRSAIATVGTAAVLMAGFSSLPAFNPGAADALAHGMPLVRYCHDKLPFEVQTPALVLVRFDAATCSVHEEPVVNPYTLEPQEAAIVMAHDLGARDGEILRHFGKAQPERNVYLLDRRSFVASLAGEKVQFLRPLGKAGALGRVAEAAGAP